jgi:adenine-specific DNA-methyltransferase
VKLLRRILELASAPDSLVMDFFAGSATTAQAVLELNHEDGGNRQFIAVQLPEATGNKEYPTITTIGQDRVRRVIKKLHNEAGNLSRTTPEDLGFKVFALGESHFAQWAGVPDRDAAKYAVTMENYLDPLAPNADPVAVAWELAIKEGYGLNSTIAKAEVGANAVYTVTDSEKDPPQSFRLCLDEQLAPDIAKQLGLTANDLFICRDAALDDTLAANLALQCRLRTV